MPGQSRLHLEVWDFQLLQEKLLGKTVMDLEDRYFSREWNEMHIVDREKLQHAVYKLGGVCVLTSATPLAAFAVARRRAAGLLALLVASGHGQRGGSARNEVARRRCRGRRPVGRGHGC